MPLNPPVPPPTRREQAVSNIQAAARRNESQIEVVALGIALAILALVVSGVALAVTAVTIFTVGAIAEALAKRGK